MPETDDLIEAARSHSIGIVGGGIAGLVVALECAKVGIPVTVWEAAHLGGAIRTVTVAGATVDVGADELSDASVLTELLAQFGLTDDLIEPAVTQRFVDAKSVVPLPESPALGIPANPFSSEVVGAIGWRGAWRAYLDRLKPVLTIGNETNLAALVLKRMGLRVNDVLVAPHTRAQLGLEPIDVNVNQAVPGLNGALTRAGSLSGGVALLDAEVPPRTLTGGLSALTDAIAARIRELGGTIHTETPVLAIAQTSDGWTVTTPELDAEDTVTTVTELVVATDERAAHSLLSGVVADLGTIASRDTVVVTFAADAAGTTRGAGVLGAGTSDAIIVDHESARWPSLHGSGTDVFRVRLADATLADDDAIAVAVATVSRQYGVTLQATDARVDRFAYAESRAALGFTDRVTAVRLRATKPHGLSVVGAWVAGASLAEVVADAHTAAEQLRRRALFPGNQVDAVNGI